MSLVHVENLNVNYGAKTVLSGVSLNVERGEIVTIVGPNGSGKTTLSVSYTHLTLPTKA